MTIESKLEKADDIIEQFWTGKGMNVKAGEKVLQNELASWYTMMGKDTTFRDMLYRKLTQEGYFRNGLIYKLEDASFTTTCATRDVHELDFRMQYICGTKYGRLERLDQGIGAEFNKNEDGTYNLKIFFKAGNNRIVLNPEWKQNPELVEAISRDFHLMYALLQETGYLAKEE